MASQQTEQQKNRLIRDYPTVERRRADGGGRRKNDVRPDSKFDQAIAYFSYYVLVFCTLCVFAPAETQAAFNLVTETFNATVTTSQVRDPGQWEIRGGLSSLSGR